MTEHAAMAGLKAGVPGVAFVGGKYVPMEEARISVLDYGFGRSDVTYDVVHVWKGNFFRLDHHIARFRSSLAKLRIELPISDGELKAVLGRCVATAGLQDAFVPMISTRGRPPLGVRDLRQCKSTFIAYAIPFVWMFNPKRNLEGASAIVPVSVRRIPDEAVDQSIKNFHWMDLDRGLLEAYDRGADTAILLGTDGHVTEGPGYNVFAVRAGRLVTADRGVLRGITRQTVIDIAAELGIPVEIRPMSRDELVGADEIFISTTAGGIAPIVKIEDRLLNNGLAGPLTTRIHDAYWTWHERPSEQTAVDYEAARAA